MRLRHVLLSLLFIAVTPASAAASSWSTLGGGPARAGHDAFDHGATTNVVEGLLLAAERGMPGNAYFVTDGEPVVFREFITDLLATQGVEPPGRSVPKPLARAIAAGGEAAWRALPLRGAPPMTRLEYWLSALETSIDISKARRELRYEPVRSIADGLRELREAGPTT